MPPASSASSGHPVARPYSQAVPGRLPNVSVGSEEVPPGSAHVCFDSRVNVRFRQRAPEWTAWKCLCDCISSAHYVHQACGRLLRFEVAGLPGPQSLVHSSRIAHTHWPFVLDARAFGIPLAVLEPLRGSTVIEALVPFYHPAFPAGFRQQVSAGAYQLLADDLPVTPNAPLPPELDVLRISPGCSSVLTAASADASADLAADSQSADIAPVPGRPPVPPLPAARWTRRLRVEEVPTSHLGPDIGMSSLPATSTGTTITVYDPVFQVRVLSCEEVLDHTELVAFALQQSPHLAPGATGRVLAHTFDAYPCPQVVVHDPIPIGDRVAPIFLHTTHTDVCTVQFAADTSPFELAIRLPDLCTAPDTLRFQVARRVAEVRINDVRAPPFLAGSAIAADTVVFNGVIQNWTPKPRSPLERLIAEEMPLSDGTLCPLQPRPSVSRPPTRIWVHRPGRAAQELPVEPHWRPAIMRDAVLHACGLGHDSRVRIPPFSPHFQGTVPHCIVLTPEDMLRFPRWSLVDFRRFRSTGPPFRLLPLPARVSFEDVACGAEPLLEPGLRVGAAFLDATPLREIPLDCAPVSLLTLAPVGATVFNPAIFFTLDVLELNTGYLSAFARCNEVRFEDLSRPLNWAISLPVSAGSTSTTSTVPPTTEHEHAQAWVPRIRVDLPVFEGPQAAHPLEHALFLVASAQCVPGAFAAHKCLHLPEIAARLLFYLSRHSFLPRMPLIEFSPRVYRSPARRTMIFATMSHPIRLVRCRPCTDVPRLPSCRRHVVTR